jgi:hypothetical protein
MNISIIDTSDFRFNGINELVFNMCVELVLPEIELSSAPARFSHDMRNQTMKLCIDMLANQGYDVSHCFMDDMKYDWSWTYSTAAINVFSQKWSTVIHVILTRDGAIYYKLAN